MRRRLVGAAVASATAAAAALTAAPALRGAMDADPGRGAATTRAVVMADAGYAPSGLVVAPGTVLTWTNRGPRNAHTITADDGSFDSGPVGVGSRWSLRVPDRTGVMPFHCAYHAYMRGTLTVTRLGLAVAGPVSLGRAAVLRGSVPGAPAGTDVALDARSDGGWVQVLVTSTGADGGFSAHLRVGRSTWVRARTAGAVSTGARVSVRARVALRRSGTHLRARLVPVSAGATVVLQRLDLDRYRWHAVGVGRTDRGGAAMLTTPRPGVYRVVVPRPGAGLDAATSRTVGMPAHRG